MSAPLNQFTTDEYVLAYHGPLLYEARILLAENWTASNTLLGSIGPHYFIHYKGWKQTWDEWVPEDRLMKVNEHNLLTRRILLESQTKKRGGGSNSAPNPGVSTVNGTTMSASASGSKMTATGSETTANAQPAAPPGAQAGRSSTPNTPTVMSATGRGGAREGRRTRGKADDSTAQASTNVSMSAGAGRDREVATRSRNANGNGNGNGERAGSNGGSTGAGKKRNREPAIEADGDPPRRPEVKIVIPDILKLQLVDDWENVTKHNQLVTLPRSPNVRDLLDEYRSYVEDTKDERSAKSRSLLNEIISGITLYFDKALGNTLLYRFERAQYVEQTRRHDDAAERQDDDAEEPPRKKAMSEIYGAEHLLRLFVNFGPFISYTNIDNDSLNILRECVNDIMKWMIREQKRLFIKEYETTSMQYQNLSRT